MCYSPITIKTPDGYRKVPCGRCLECLVKYQQDWSNRMYEELKAHDGKAVFFTLTYDENNVPKNYLYYDYDRTKGEVTYDLFRSPSDYGYSNIYTDEKGKERVLPSRGRERKCRAVAPYVELQQAGLDTDKILDFNIKRKNHKEFIEQIYKIYGNFVRTITDDCTSVQVPGVCSASSTDSTYDFDSYDGDDFSVVQDFTQSCSMANEMFASVVEDDDYESGDNPILAARVSERPIMSFNSVRKKDIQDWLKRGRMKLKRDKGLEFTYFITSEYGPRTLRPHYHGILFGVTAEEAICMAKDWQRHHGERIQWDNMDLSKGDGSYCAKYCAKGFFEHPLCSRDFFYSKALQGSDGMQILPFSEYHSKHYERCIELFGIDAPIVDKTFKLISKGFGSKWIDDNKYLVEDFTDWTEFEFDSDSSVTPSITVQRTIAPWDTDYTDYTLKGYKPDESGFITVDIPTDKTNNKNLKSKNYEETIERLFRRYKYNRTYGEKTYAYGVPKYYRAKIFNDSLRCAFANYVQCANVEIYRQKLAALFPDGLVRETPEMVSQLETQERQTHYDRARKIYKQLERQYNKVKI